ncbi:symporter [Aureococcus anophagefferens]|nr:symporter [Aureococcus anophagefferens]
MPPSGKIEVAEEGNKRRGEMSPAEVRQCSKDIVEWFRKHADLDAVGTPQDDVDRMAKRRALPLALEELYLSARDGICYAWLKPDAGASTLRATRSHKAAAVAAGTPLSFRVRNAYVDAYGEPGTLYSWASSYDAIAEPHKWQELVAVWAAAGNATNVTWAFDDGSTASGAAVLKKFFALRTYAISLTAADENGTSVAYAGTVIVKYIRREIRQLTDGDRHAWLDAMQTLWNTRSTRVSLPYWDFTIDKWLLDSGNLSSVWRSPIFDASWLGGVNRDTLTIDEGRWANIAVAANQWTATHNSYGYLRAPWNNNPQPYLTRVPDMCGYSGTALPSCVEHYFLLTSETWYDFAWTYRSGDLEMPQYCSAETPFAECHAACTSHKDVEAHWGVMFSWYEEVESYAWLTSKVKRYVIDAVCDGGIGADGDQLESGSPMDPSFWPIHPTMERLFIYKKISDTFESESWPGTGSAAVTNCTGHQKSSVIPFAFSLRDGDEGGDPTMQTLYTNEEMYDLLDPASPVVPFIYADFDWAHCDSAIYGLDFTDFLTSTTGAPSRKVHAASKGRKGGRRWLYAPGDER